MYTIKRRAVDDFVAADIQVLTSTGVHTTYKIVQSEMVVTRLLFTIETVVSSSVSAVVKFWRRPALSSTSGQVSLGTLTIPTGAAVSKTYYKDISPVTVFPGDQITYEVTTAATSTGKGFANVELADNPEAAGNQTNMVASA